MDGSLRDQSFDHVQERYTEELLSGHPYSVWPGQDVSLRCGEEESEGLDV